MWKKLTAEANRAYVRNDIASARKVYGQALSEAEKLFDAAMTGRGLPPGPVIYNVSCHNLAELEERQGSQDAAGIYFRRAYDRLMEAAGSPAVPLAQRVSCVQHLKQALAALVRHLHENGGSETGETADLVNDLVSRAHRTAFNVYHVARHAEIADAGCSHCAIGLS
ncbi:MAG: hypothetical protein ACOYJQ_18000 [Pseudochelatococcus sp.]|uniref:hypothetical protein n=1 Tax=Pseudochelatococcus sp. TaxID=2020869 RepID=UPI003D8DDE10